MFFWGLGTSEIAQHSFGWQDTTSASALAGEYFVSFVLHKPGTFARL